MDNTSTLRGACNLCGKCCEAIHIPVSPERIEDLAKMEINIKDKLSDPVFIHENWVPISRDEALNINPHLRANVEIYKGKHDGKDPYEGMFFYTCKQFDKETRLCRVHDNLPHVCSGYPWYGRRPNINEMFYDDNCGYIVDVEDAKKEKEKEGVKLDETTSIR